MEENRLPTLILGGAQKAGTTTLHYLLDSHPQIFFPSKPQEIHFFDDERAYQKGLPWYSKLFRNWNGEAVIAQTSPLYLYSSEVPTRIYQHLPDVRFIFILRNPVDRAYSHYWHEVRYGLEPLSFEEALKQEPERISKGPYERRNFSYVDRGNYLEQLDRFDSLFRRNQILLIRLEDLRSKKLDVRQCLARFLDLNSEEFKPMPPGGLHLNQHQTPRWIRLQRLIRQTRRPFPRIGYVVDTLNLKQQAYPPMQPETQAKLRQLFRPGLMALQDRWDVDVSSWLEEPQEADCHT